MDWGSVIGGGLSAAGSIASGLLGNQGSGHSAQYYIDKNIEYEKEIARSRPGWLVQGAKNAGLHPLAVLGMSTSSGPSFSMGDTGSNYQDVSWLNDAGQGIARAAGALVDRKTRAQQEQFNQVQMQQKLENNDLQNQLLRAQIRQYGVDDAVATLANGARMAITNQQQNPPFSVGRNGAVIDGQGDSTVSSLFKVKPAEIVASEPSRPGTEAGSVTDLGFTRTNDGGYSPVMSNDAKQRIEDDLVGEIGWNVRNRIPSAFSLSSVAPPSSFLPNGDAKRYTWIFDIPRGAWYAIPRSSSGWDKFRASWGFR